MAFVIELEKPVSCFFPESIVKNAVMDVKPHYQHEILELIRGIEYFCDTELTKEIIQLLYNYYGDQADKKDFE